MSEIRKNSVRAFSSLKNQFLWANFSCCCILCLKSQEKIKLSTSHFCKRVFYHCTTFLKHFELLRWLQCQVICVLKWAKLSRKAYSLHKSKYFKNDFTDFTLQLRDVRIIIPFDVRASFKFRNHFVC